MRASAKPFAEQHLIDMPNTITKQQAPGGSLTRHGITRYEVELDLLPHVLRTTVKRSI
jgi:hypothetical protein